MDNPRYIDLNKLTARLPVLNDNGEHLVAISDVRRAISLAQAETGEVVEVIHAAWITDGGGIVVCSNCGEEHSWIEYRPTYCEDCGAKMDGKEQT